MANMGMIAFVALSAYLLLIVGQISFGQDHHSLQTQCADRGDPGPTRSARGQPTRMLVCQAIVQGLVLLTPDEAICQYPVRTQW